MLTWKEVKEKIIKSLSEEEKRLIEERAKRDFRKKNNRKS
jgi:hypothetical protein